MTIWTLETRELACAKELSKTSDIFECIQSVDIRQAIRFAIKIADLLLRQCDLKLGLVPLRSH